MKENELPELKYGVIYVATNPDKTNDVGEIVIDIRKFIENFAKGRRWSKFDVERIDMPNIGQTTLMARRFNVGNMGKEATVRMPLIDDSFGLCFSDFMRFMTVAEDVTSPDDGDKTILIDTEPPLRRFSKSIHRRIALSPSTECASSKECFDISDDFVGSCMMKMETMDDIVQTEEDREESELADIESAREIDLQRIQAAILDYVAKYHTDPSDLVQTLLKGKFVIGNPPGISPLVVNKDLKIILPNYNEVEVKMPALCRAIYILFLRHPEGIALRDIADHRAELESIYTIVKPGRDDAIAAAAFDNLLNPMSNTLKEYISKIKRCFALCIINDEVARNYYITGKKGEAYGVALNPELITLPRAVS
ncbi:MAG: hypothetical protein J6U03_00635 [Muribaculaceae bacterium]|nr:hypothetical protein [Muribaculaceae bacterium]